MGMRMEQINIAPGPEEIANIIRLIRGLYVSPEFSDRFQAFVLLEAGWPHMKIGKAINLLEGKIEIEEAVEP